MQPNRNNGPAKLNRPWSFFVGWVVWFWSIWSMGLLIVLGLCHSWAFHNVPFLIIYLDLFILIHRSLESNLMYMLYTNTKRMHEYLGSVLGSFIRVKTEKWTHFLGSLFFQPNQTVHLKKPDRFGPVCWSYSVFCSLLTMSPWWDYLLTCG